MTTADLTFTPFVPQEQTPNRFAAGLGLDVNTVGELLERLEQGLPADAFGRLQSLLGVSQKVLAGYLGLSEATLHRRFAEGQFRAEESERLYRYAEMFEKAVHLFEDEAKARAWLGKPALALGGQTPLDFARSEQGAREVLDVIERLEYGVLG